MPKIILDILPPSRGHKENPAPKPTPVHLETASAFHAPLIIEAIPLVSLSPKKHRGIFQKGLLTVLLLLVLAGGVTMVGFYDLKKTVDKAVPRVTADFLEASDSLRNFETGKAKSALFSIKMNVDLITDKARQYGISTLATFWSAIVPKLKAVPDTLKNITTLSETALRFAGTLHELRNNSFTWLMHREGRKVRESISALSENLDTMIAAHAGLKNQSLALAYPVGNNFLDVNADLYSTQRFLKAFLGWFSEPRDKRLLVLFQNPSELRPGGGFLGSYADITLDPDGIRDIVVWDVYDPDGQLDVKILPPRELQGITTTWGARDANWFFDFPTSASKVISMLENSKIYREKLTTFDGAIAVNINVFRSILALIGPIELPEYGLVITPDNFLSEIQREVESGEDNKNGEPKRILKVLAPMVFDRLGSLDDTDRQNIFKIFQHHVSEKDIMFYFKDWEFQNFMQQAQVAGDVLPLPLHFKGDYLAVVSANVAGGKSDAFVRQLIKLSTKIDVSGKIDNFLTIERTHDGAKEKDPWYRASNKTYLKVFTPQGSDLSYAKGGDILPLKSVVDYEKKNYLFDTDLRNIEATRKSNEEYDMEMLEESGKTVFGTWVNTKAGTSKMITLQYTNSVKLSMQEKEIPYQFIFERQSGAKTAIDILLDAPEGYIWKETGTANFNYVDENPEGRIQLSLTLLQNPTGEQPPRE
ncbi:MAG: DUF4012 domain-containing protein [Patescibacteria group bacterium]